MYCGSVRLCQFDSFWAPFNTTNRVVRVARIALNAKLTFLGPYLHSGREGILFARRHSFFSGHFSLISLGLRLTVVYKRCIFSIKWGPTGWIAVLIAGQTYCGSRPPQETFSSESLRRHKKSISIPVHETHSCIWTSELMLGAHVPSAGRLGVETRLLSVLTPRGQFNYVSNLGWRPRR